MPFGRDGFGSSVDIAGDSGKVLIGSDANIEDADRAFLFNFSGDLLQVLEEPEELLPFRGTGFGSAVAINSEYAVVGVRGTIVGTDRPDGAYLYRVVPEPSSVMLVVIAVICMAFRRLSNGVKFLKSPSASYRPHAISVLASTCICVASQQSNALEFIPIGNLDVQTGGRFFRVEGVSDTAQTISPSPP